MNTGNCAKSVRSEGMSMIYHQCLRKGVLKYKGELFCKQHHPPSIASREAATPKCTWKWSSNVLCGNKLKPGEGPWCLHCRRREASNRVYAKCQAYDRVVKLLDELELDSRSILKFPVRVRKALQLKGVQQVCKISGI